MQTSKVTGISEENLVEGEGTSSISAAAAKPREIISEIRTLSTKSNNPSIQTKKLC
jgi:hypothetical protein